MDRSSPAVAMEKPQRKANQRFEGAKPRKVRFSQTVQHAAAGLCCFNEQQPLGGGKERKYIRPCSLIWF